ncbi:MAG: hypothetical protein ACRYGI_11390 [Janthinobacterium lividum]
MFIIDENLDLSSAKVVSDGANLRDRIRVGDLIFGLDVQMGQQNDMLVYSIVMALQQYAKK